MTQSRDEPLSSQENRPPTELETNIMTQGELDRLRESCLLLVGVHSRLPAVGETVTLARSGKGDAEKRDEEVGDVPPIGDNEGESRHSRDDSSVEYIETLGGLRKGVLASLPNKMQMRISRLMSKKMDIKKLSIMENAAKATPSPTRSKGPKDEERPTKKAKGASEIPLEVSHSKKKSPLRRVTRSIKPDIPPSASEALIFGSSPVGQVRRMREWMETRDVTISSLKGEVEQARREAMIDQKRVTKIAEEKEKVAAAKTLFDLAREKLEKEFKKIKLCFPALDIDNMEINPNLAEEGDGDEVVMQPWWKIPSPWAIKPL
ncbi:hypothetical protein Acr_05g0010290 [Actinidia rufa]|uniref:Uncharacterized protein n=1 Tax=Actinidia rufa TaxID=165716 RepID=A0A7J0ELW6_9ERIC|nr:hypothetical protein Acr_05g0010290 [Actinidia rufa]